MMNGTMEQLSEALAGLTFTPMLTAEEAASRTGISRLIRFQLQLLDASRSHSKFDELIVAHARTASDCAGGWKGAYCR